MRRNESSKPAATGNAVASVEDYLAQVPEPARSTLETVRARIRAALPAEATEGLSYGMPAFRFKKPLVGYAAFKEHCSFFPMSGTVIETLAEDLKSYQTSKGTIRFPANKPLSATLINKIVKARLAEVEGLKKPAKKASVRRTAR